LGVTNRISPPWVGLKGIETGHPRNHAHRRVRRPELRLRGIALARAARQKSTEGAIGVDHRAFRGNGSSCRRVESLAAVLAGWVLTLLDIKLHIGACLAPAPYLEHGGNRRYKPMPVSRARSGTRSGWIKVKTPEWKAANQYRAKLFEKPARG
jgi:hypothetical protein